MFLRFAICLSPLCLVGIIALLAGDKIANESGFSLIVFLTGIGALLLGFFVGRLVYRAITDPVWLKYFLGILVFLIVVIGYAGQGLFGGCMLLIVTSK